MTTQLQHYGWQQDQQRNNSGLNAALDTVVTYGSRTYSAIAQLGYATDVAYSPDGARLIVADFYNKRIQLFSVSDSAITLITTHAVNSLGNDGPFSIAWSPNGTRLAIVTQWTNTIHILAISGNAITPLAEYTETVTSPVPNFAGIAFSPDSSRLVVTDTRNNKIFVYGLLGATITLQAQFGSSGGGNGQFDRPLGITFSPNGTRIVVADHNKDRIQILGISGNTVSFVAVYTGIGGAFYALQGPYDVAFTPDGASLFVVMSGGRLAILSISGDVATYRCEHGLPLDAGYLRSADGNFDYPNGVAINPTGTRVAVADTHNHRIQVLALNETSASFHSYYGSQGAGPGAFNTPKDIAIGGNDMSTGLWWVLVADTANDRIQVFNATNTSLTYANTFGGSGAGDGQFSAPTNVAVNSDCTRIVVADGNSRIQVFGMQANDPTNIYHLVSYGTAGSGTGQFAAPTATPSPTGVAFTPDNLRIFVADTNNNRIVILGISAANAITHQAAYGTAGSGNGQFNSPRGIAISPNGARLAVADTLNSRVQIFSRINATLTFQVAFGTNGSGPDQFLVPHGVTWSPDGTRLAVTDPTLQKVKIYSVINNIVTYLLTIPMIGTGNGLSAPLNAAFSRDGAYIFAASTGAHKIGIYKASYSPMNYTMNVGATSINPRGLNQPYAVSVSRDGLRVAVVDMNAHNIWIYGVAGGTTTYQTMYGSFGSANGQFKYPTGIAFTPDGSRIAVSDTSNNRIVMLGISGNTVTFQSSYGALGSGVDQFNGPRNLSFDSSGSRMVVADISNNRIVMLGVTGSAVTHIAHFGTSGTGDGQLNFPYSATFSPDDTVIAVADTGNHRIQLFNVVGNSLTFKAVYGVGVLSSPSHVSFNADGTRLAVSNVGSGSIYLLRLFGSAIALVDVLGTKGARAGQFENPMGTCFFPDGGRMAVADTMNGRVSVIGVNTAPLTFQTKTAADENLLHGQFGGNPMSFAYNPYGGRIAVGESNRIQIFGVSDTTVLHQADITFPEFSPGVSTFINGVAYSPNGFRIAVTDIGGQCVHLLSVVGNTITPLYTYGGPTEGLLAEPYGVAFTPDGSRLIISDTALGNFVFFDTTNDVLSLVATIHIDGTIGAPGLSPTGIAVSPDGLMLAVCNPGDGTVNMFSIAGDTVAFMWAYGVTGDNYNAFNMQSSIAFNSDGTRLAVSDTYNFRVSVFEVKSNELLLEAVYGSYGDGRVAGPTGYGGPGSIGRFGAAHGVAFGPDGSRIVAGDYINFCFHLL